MKRHRLILSLALIGVCGWCLGLVGQVHSTTLENAKQTDLIEVSVPKTAEPACELTVANHQLTFSDS